MSEFSVMIKDIWPIFQISSCVSANKQCFIGFSLTGLQTCQLPSGNHWLVQKIECSQTVCKWLLVVAVKLTAQAPFTQAYTPVGKPLVTTGCRGKCVFCYQLENGWWRLLVFIGVKLATKWYKVLWLLADCSGCHQFTWKTPTYLQTVKNYSPSGSEIVKSAIQIGNRGCSPSELKSCSKMYWFERLKKNVLFFVCITLFQVSLQHGVNGKCLQKTQHLPSKLWEPV